MIYARRAFQSLHRPGNEISFRRMQIAAGRIHAQMPFGAREAFLSGKSQALEEKPGEVFHGQSRRPGDAVRGINETQSLQVDVRRPLIASEGVGLASPVHSCRAARHGMRLMLCSQMVGDDLVEGFWHGYLLSIFARHLPQLMLIYFETITRSSQRRMN